jgi:5-methylcytosine-specific restriction enzyme subunit McrC
MSKRKTITVFEDRYSQQSFTEEQRSELLSLESIWGRQNLNLRADDRLILRRYVGFLSTPSLQIQILPKIFEDVDSLENVEEEKQQSVRMLFRLLQSSGFLSVKDIPDPQQISEMDGDLLEIYIHLFVKKFLDLYHRQIHRQYEEQEENMVIVKGSIMFQQQLLQNGSFKHKHYVRYQEFTDDNLLNQIFKTTMVSLRTVTKNEANKKKLNLAIILLEDIKIVRLTESLFKQVRFNRLNESYQPVFQLAKLFYHNRQPGVHSGDERTFTFLIPLNQLFEFSIFQWLKEALDQDGLSVLYQKPQRYLDDLNKVFTLKPDITVWNGDSIQMIVDAKYKNPVENSEVHLSESDVYQMLAYAVRYECNRLCLVYPNFRGNKEWRNPLVTYQIKSGAELIHITAIHVDISAEDLSQAKEELLRTIRVINKTNVEDRL